MAGTGRPGRAVDPAGPAEPAALAARQARAVAIRQGVAVGVATGLYGISFGALAVAAGLSIWQTQVLSLVMFTGGSQFALVGVIGAGGLGSAAV
ncbi:MAG: AzlC family ABC transporter permease, partial [Bifidobacteriaceae bacterium]|nr:AzlC family ABC transporter permease [Bifidobacteriaceae bacterium]